MTRSRCTLLKLVALVALLRWTPLSLLQAVPLPNILWITIEDASPDLGCYGDAVAHTSRIDGLAREGALFRNAFSVSGVCAPSRSALITGMYPIRIGTHHMDDSVVPPPYVRCFTEYLRAAGYSCTNTGKTHYNFPAPLTAWDRNVRDADWRSRAPGQPFFSVINFEISHEGYIRDRVPGMFARATNELGSNERQDPREVRVPPYYPDTPVVRNDLGRYYDLLRAVDRKVGKVLDRLDEDGLRSSTIVFFFSDHGRGLTRAKRWIYDSGMRVPLIVRWPGRIAPGSVRHDLVSFVDFAPTVLSLAGCKIPHLMDGQVFLGERRGPPREYVHAARDRMDETYDRIRAVRDTRFKYIRNFEPEKPYAQVIRYAEQMPTLREMRRLHGEGRLRGAERLFFLPHKPSEELYDLLSDPHEVRNLADRPRYAETLARLRTELERWLDATGDQGDVPEHELDERMRPRGLWSVTQPPVVTPPGGSFAREIEVTIECATEGAAIAYTTDTGEPTRWKLYHEPVRLSPTARLRARAVRLGYHESAEVSVDFLAE